MSLHWRAYGGEGDLGPMAALVRLQPEENVHLADLPYRLSSWALDDPANAALWETPAGELMAWAVLQAPFWALDYAYHPAAPADTHARILDWADERARAMRGTRLGRLAWFVNIFDGQRLRQQELAAHGWASQADVGEDSWTKVLFQLKRPITSPVPPPQGYHLRSLRGAGEVEGYVALHRAVFGTENMTVGWRQAMLRHPDYRPELDLVAVDKDGALAGFCVCWFTSEGGGGRPSGQIEPLGVREDARRCGLARALVEEGLSRLAQLGSEAVVVETDDCRDDAYSFYEAVGFRVARKILVYRKDYTS